MTAMLSLGQSQVGHHFFPLIGEQFSFLFYFPLPLAFIPAAHPTSVISSQHLQNSCVLSLVSG